MFPAMTGTLIYEVVPIIGDAFLTILREERTLFEVVLLSLQVQLPEDKL